MPRRPRRLARPSFYWTPMDGFGVVIASPGSVRADRATEWRQRSGRQVVRPDAPKPPTSDDLKDGQLATTFTHQALAVREAVLKDATTRRRILALILHEKVRSEALAIRHEANGSTVHADHAEGFSSAALDAIRKRRAELDPLHDKHYVEDHAAYDALQALSDKKLDALIDLLTVEMHHRPFAAPHRIGLASGDGVGRGDSTVLAS